MKTTKKKAYIINYCKCALHKVLYTGISFNIEFSLYDALLSVRHSFKPLRTDKMK